MLQTLINIYNTLNLVDTKGQSSIYIGACLSTLKDLIDEENKKQIEIKKEDQQATQWSPF